MPDTAKDYLSNREASWLAQRVFKARESLTAMSTDDTLGILYTLAADAYRHGKAEKEA